MTRPRGRRVWRPFPAALSRTSSTKRPPTSGSTSVPFAHSAFWSPLVTLWKAKLSNFLSFFVLSLSFSPCRFMIFFIRSSRRQKKNSPLFGWMSPKQVLAIYIKSHLFYKRAATAGQRATTTRRVRNRHMIPALILHLWLNDLFVLNCTSLLILLCLSYLGDFKCAIKEEVTLTSGEWEVLGRHGSKVRGYISKLVIKTPPRVYTFSFV